MGRICKACLIDKEDSCFYFKNASKGRLDTTCKECRIAGNISVKPPKDTENKTCKSCGDTKPVSEYQKAGGGKWLQPYCKDCDSARKKEWVLKNHEELKAKNNLKYKNWRERNPIQPKEKKPRKKDDKEYVRQRLLKYTSTPEFKIKKRAADKAYKEANREKVAARKKEYYYSQNGLQKAKDWQKAQMSDPEFRIKKNLRGRVYVALKRGIKTESTMALLGCTIEHFTKYFEGLFYDDMSWERYMKGEIHIDHIKPCILFDLTIPEQQKECFHYTNLQPLWKVDNLKKGKSYSGKNI